MLAHKSWFFLDDRIVCLGAGIATTAENSVYTTLEQCLQRGECPAEGEVCKLEDGRFWHDGMGWVVHDGPVLNEWHGMVEGSWYRANNNLSRDSIEKPVLRLWLDHGKAPADEGYAYTIFPECEKQQLYGENINTEVEILQNSPSCQAVYDASKGAVYAIFYSAGELHLPNQKNLRAGAPAVAIVEMGKSAIRATPLDRRVHQVEVALEG